eukprot:220343-Pelagomonas_calceolata.AAC.1
MLDMRDRLRVVGNLVRSHGRVNALDGEHGTHPPHGGELDACTAETNACTDCSGGVWSAGSDMKACSH